jgi:hypothetical protein
MKHAVLLVALLLTACPPPLDPAQPPPPEHPGTEAECAAMCQHLGKLGCEPAPDCKDACWNAESSGVLTLCPVAVAQAKDCDEAERFSTCGQ